LSWRLKSFLKIRHKSQAGVFFGAGAAEMKKAGIAPAFPTALFGSGLV
jgi:hypothetical protein